MKKLISYHSKTQSPFYKLRSRSKLASILFIGRKQLDVLSKNQSLYRSFSLKKGDGSARNIDAPRPDLKAVQLRIADLLMRMTPPDYLYAPVKGRSYIDNAAVHRDATAIRLLDLADFFPSCSQNKVAWFFVKFMQCSPDVGSVLTSIVTKDGYLPQGSPCSSIMAYLAYVDMWEEISNIVSSFDCKLSVYADDITISGRFIPESMIFDVKSVIRKHGHAIKRQKERKKFGRPAEITGVIVTKSSMIVPNRQRKAIIDLNVQLSRATVLEERKRIESRLRGRRSQMDQIRKKASLTS